MLFLQEFLPFLIFWFRFLVTAGAEPGELQLIPCDGGLRQPPCVLQKAGRQRCHGQILHLAAASADEVRMGIDMGVVPLQPAHHADGLNGARLLEHGKVAVHRPQAEVGIDGLELLVDPFRRGMTRGIAHAVENGVTLSAVLSFTLHVSSKTVMILITV